MWYVALQLKSSTIVSLRFKKTMETSRWFVYLVDEKPPSMSLLYLGVYIFLYTRSKLMYLLLYPMYF